MRLSQAPPSLLSLILILLSNSHSVTAGPYPKNELHNFGFGWLMDRGCDSYCGYEDQYCCSAGEVCFTNAATIAECLTSAAGGWAFYTTVTTETDLIVKTITGSSFTGPTATATSANPETTVSCQYALGETACGAICCSSSQYCQQSGQCVVSGGTASAGATTFSAPVLGTSGASTITKTATTTQPFETPVGTSGSSIGVTSNSTSHGLSGGAIAGIVIGVLAGIVLLILICFCCILRSGFDAILGIFGLGPNRRRRREEVVTTEERYSRRNASASGAAGTRRNWFGASRPRRTTVVNEKKQGGGFGGFGMVGAGLLGLAAILGLKRRHDRKEVVRKEERVTTRPERSDISSDYYSDYYTGTTESSASSDDRRTRTTHHTPRR